MIRSFGSTKRVLHAAQKQRAIGERGERVIERLVAKLLLERLAFRYVAAGKDDAGDRGVVEQVQSNQLVVSARVVGEPQTELCRLPSAVGPDRPGQKLVKCVDVVRLDEIENAAANQRIGRVAPGRSGGGTLIDNLTGRVRDEDDLGRAAEQGSQPLLAATQGALVATDDPPDEPVGCREAES